MTFSGIGKSVTITDCHSNSVTLIVLNESGIAKTVTVADCHCNRCHYNRHPLNWDRAAAFKVQGYKVNFKVVPNDDLGGK